MGRAAFRDVMPSLHPELSRIRLHFMSDSIGRGPTSWLLNARGSGLWGSLQPRVRWQPGASCPPPHFYRLDAPSHDFMKTL